MESPTDYFRRWFHRWQCHVTVRLSQFESLGNSVGKIAWRHHAVAYFQTNCIPRRRNRRYIPMEIFCRFIPTGLYRRYIPTDFETELFPSVIITDGIFPSVIPLVFSSFLVVFLVSPALRGFFFSPVLGLLFSQFSPCFFSLSTWVFRVHSFSFWFLVPYLLLFFPLGFFPP